MLVGGKYLGKHVRDFLPADSRGFLGDCLGEIGKDDLQPGLQFYQAWLDGWG